MEAAGMMEKPDLFNDDDEDVDATAAQEVDELMQERLELLADIADDNPSRFKSFDERWKSVRSFLHVRREAAHSKAFAPKSATEQPVAEKDEMPPEQTDLEKPDDEPPQTDANKPKQTKTNNEIAKAIVFLAIEKQLFISVKSVILNLVVKEKNLSEVRAALRDTLIEIALDIVEEFEARELPPYFPIVEQAIALRRPLLEYEITMLRELCEETRFIVEIFTAKFYNYMESKFTSITLGEPKAAGFRKSATRYVLNGMWVKGKLMQSEKKLDRESLEYAVLEAKKKILEEYFETEMVIRQESKLRKLFMNGREKFFKININKYLVEKISEDLKKETLLTLQSIWTAITDMYRKIPEIYRPTIGFPERLIQGQTPASGSLQ